MADKFQYGGQAVIEGVMMRGKRGMAVAVRRPDSGVSVHTEPIDSLTQRHPIWRLPFFRGVVALGEAFSIGMKALMYSANEAAGGEEQGKLTPWETTLTVGMACVLVVVLFILLPLGAAALMKRAGLPRFAIGLGEALIRAVILVGYIRLVTLVPDIQRVFAYHGAEHKVIHTYEAGEELTVGNARVKTALHPRCGTSFLFFVVLVSAILFTMLATKVWYIKILTRLALLPVVAGISFELIKLAGRQQAFFLIRWLSAPGMWLQRMTTREPDDAMIEVAITALESAIAADVSEPRQPNLEQQACLTN